MSAGTDLTARILELLETDGRMSTTEISRRLDVSDAVVRQRLRRIFDASKVKRGVVVDFSVLGIDTVACLHVSLVAEHLHTAAERLARQPSIALTMAVTGPANLFVIAVARGAADLGHLIDEHVRVLPGFIAVKVSLISEALKYDVRFRPDIVPPAVE